MPTQPLKTINYRVPMDLYEAAKAEAEALHISFNSYALQALQSYVEFTRSVRMKREAKGRALPPAAALSAKATTFPKVGRNDTCPCGSGQKAKFCAEGHPQAAYC